jgi:hypothetical protein
MRDSVGQLSSVRQNSMRARTNRQGSNFYVLPSPKLLVANFVFDLVWSKYSNVRKTKEGYDGPFP